MDPICTIGIISDVQYANVDDATNHEKTKIRRYRKTEEFLKQAVSKFTKVPNLSFVLNLGDLIDGKCHKQNESLKSLEKMFSCFDEGGFLNKTIHTIGNHEYYNFNRDELRERLLYNIQSIEPNADNLSYRVKIHDKINIIHIDTYDLTSIENSRSESHKNHIRRDSKQKFWNGGVSKEQLIWLEKELELFQERQEMVIIIGHCCIHQDATNEENKNMVWNHEEVLELLGKYKNTVVAYFAGHHHSGGFCTDLFGIHHVTMKGIIEHTDNNAFSVLRFYKNYMAFEGFGDCESMSLPYSGGISLNI